MKKVAICTATLLSVIALGLLAPDLALAKKKQPPTCVLAANPETLSQPGESTTLSWTTTNASSFTVDHGIGAIAQVTSGSLVLAPESTTYYTGTAVGKGGSVTCSTNIEVRAWSLAGDWILQFEGGHVTDADGFGRVDAFASSPIMLAINAQPGLLYEGGMHVYQGTLPRYGGSWVYMLYTPNVHPNKQKYLEVYVGIPDVSFGDVPGIHVFSCKLFLERTSESYGWGVMTGEYREGQDAPVPGVAEVPEELFTSTCRIWKQWGKG